MTIQFRDFFPESLPSRKKVLGLIPVPEHEPLDVVLERVNEWVAAERVDVVNVETVLLPQVEGAAETARGWLVAQHDFNTNWYQIIRVWFRAGT
jgi:hypothetical protein